MLLVGIDPGTTTGYAVWDAAKQRWNDVTSMDVISATKRIEALREHRIGLGRSLPLVVFEDAYLRRCFGRMDKLVQKYGQGVREGAGAAKRDAAIWRTFLAGAGVPYIGRAPATKGTKEDGQYFRAITGWTGRTNEHARDAAMLVFGYDLPGAMGLLLEAEQLRKAESA